MRQILVDEQPTGLLARRYPARRTSSSGTLKTVYVLREYLNFEERQANIDRLRRERKTVLADALEQETNRLFKTGRLPHD